MRSELVELCLIVEQYNAAHASYCWLSNALWLPNFIKAMLLSWVYLAWAVISWFGIELDSADRIANNPRLAAFWGCLFGQAALPTPTSLLQPTEAKLCSQPLVIFNLRALLAKISEDPDSK